MPALAAQKIHPRAHPQAFAGRYQCQKRLSIHNGIETWKGVDRDLDAPVVIKFESDEQPHPGASDRLKKEAESLSECNTTELVKIIDSGTDDGTRFVVVEFVSGPSLRQHLDTQGPMDPVAALTVFRCVFSALANMHKNDFVHGDVKPENIIVIADADGLHGKLIDCGFASRPNQDDHLILIGGVQYAAPERLGLIGIDYDFRSDLYAAGASLYECLTGTPPFTGRNRSEIIDRMLNCPLSPARELRPTLPGSFDAVLSRLLQRDPTNRYHSAGAVLHDLGRIEKNITLGMPDAPLFAGASDRRKTITTPTFVGREEELTKAAAAFQAAGQGSPAVLLVEAISGGGKTSYLDEAAVRARSRGAFVFRGGALGDVAPTPFGALESAVQQVVDAAETDPRFRCRLAVALINHADTLREVFPSLRAILGSPSDSDYGPEVFGVRRTFLAVAAFLDALGEQDHPAVVILDDCQWLDGATQDLVLHWNASNDGARASSHTSLVLAYRDDEVPEGHSLRKLRAKERIALPPLSPNDLRDLLTSMAGPLPEEVHSLIARLSGGSPFMAASTLRGLGETGVIRAGDDGWVLDSTKMADASASYRSGIFLSRRIERLEDHDLEVLTAAAVIGRHFLTTDVAALTRRDLGDVEGTLGRAKDIHLLWHRAHGEYAFVHDKVREALLGRAPPAERLALHRRIAEHFEAENPGDLFSISYHFAAAGSHHRALPYAVAAAEEARRRASLDVAEHHYRIARQGASGSPVGTRRRVAEGLGDVLMLRGQYDEAHREFERAQTLSDTLFKGAEIDGKLGELSFKRGEMEEAAQYVERALSRLGRRVPGSRLAFATRALWEVLVQVLHSVFPSYWVHRVHGQPPDHDLLAARLYSRLAHIYWFHRGAAACMWAHLREMNLAERYSPTAELAQAYSEHAPVMTIVSNYERGLRYVRRSLEIRKELNSIWGQGQAHHFLGVLLYGASRYERCIEHCKKSIDLLQRAGDQWEIHTATWHIALSHYRRGELEEAAHQARKVYESAGALGDAQSRAIGAGVWSKATMGFVPEAVFADDARVSEADAHAAAEYLQGRAIYHLRRGATLQAIESLEHASSLVKSRGLRQEYVAPIPAWLATAYRERLQSLPHHAHRARRECKRAMGRAARKALLLAFFYRNNLPHALRELGYVLADRGLGTIAIWLFSKGIRVAQDQGAKLEEACSLIARGQVGLDLQRPQAREDLLVGQRMYDEITSSVRVDAPPLEDRQERVSISDRFDRLLESTRELATATTDRELVSMLRRAGTRVLRAHQCEVILARELSDAPAWVSQTTLARATTERKTISITNGLLNGVTDSVVTSGTRSVMCVPIFVYGDLHSLLYVTHPAFGSFFGPMEEGLGSLLAYLASMTLRNIHGVAEARATVEAQETIIARANEAVEARDAFISIASHELKTPLTALKLQNQLLHRELCDGGSTSPAALRVQAIDRQVERMVNLVDQLLDVSRITLGKFELERSSTDLSQIVDDVVQRMQPLITASKCNFHLDIDRNVTGVWDEGRLDQIVTNLLTNAIKYGAGTPVELRLKKNRQYADFSVRDHGIGIGESDRNRIFDRFERLVSDQNYGGFGLGLWIVRQIVERHHGTIHVESSPGRGSLFTVRLPLGYKEQEP